MPHLRRWKREEFFAMRGTPWEPVAGKEDNEVKPNVHIKTEEDLVRQLEG